MNRRDLIKRGAQALLGVGGIVIGVKAAPPNPQVVPVVVTINDSKFAKAIVAHVVDDVKANGPIRNAMRG